MKPKIFKQHKALYDRETIRHLVFHDTGIMPTGLVATVTDKDGNLVQGELFTVEAFVEEEVK